MSLYYKDSTGQNMGLLFLVHIHQHQEDLHPMMLTAAVSKHLVPEKH